MKNSFLKFKRFIEKLWRAYKQGNMVLKKLSRDHTCPLGIYRVAGCRIKELHNHTFMLSGKINNKWYGVLMKVEESKLYGDSLKKIEVLDLKYDKNKVTRLRAGEEGDDRG